MKEFARVSYSSIPEGFRRLATIINKLINEHPYHDITTITSADSPYTATGRYRTILCDCTSGAITVNLPSFTDFEGSFSIKKTDSSSNAVTVDPAGSETIDGMTTITWAAQYDSYTIASNGASGNIV